MNIVTTLSQTISQALQSLYGIESTADNVVLQATRREFTGDYTLVVFPFVKQARRSPDAVGHDAHLFRVQAVQGSPGKRAAGQPPAGSRFHGRQIHPALHSGILLHRPGRHRARDAGEPLPGSGAGTGHPHPGPFSPACGGPHARRQRGRPQHLRSARRGGGSALRQLHRESRRPNRLHSPLQHRAFGRQVTCRSSAKSASFGTLSRRTMKNTWRACSAA